MLLFGYVNAVSLCKCRVVIVSCDSCVCNARWTSFGFDCVFLWFPADFSTDFCLKLRLVDVASDDAFDFCHDIIIPSMPGRLSVHL